MSNDLFAGIGVVPGTFLLPRPDADWTAWACVACDQYTSEPEYWQRVNTLVGHQPSTLRLILPECDLPAPPERIDAIHAAMRDALNVLHPGVTDGFVLLERTTSTGQAAWACLLRRFGAVPLRRRKDPHPPDRGNRCVAPARASCRTERRTAGVQPRHAPAG